MPSVLHCCVLLYSRQSTQEGGPFPHGGSSHFSPTRLYAQQRRFYNVVKWGMCRASASAVCGRSHSKQKGSQVCITNRGITTRCHLDVTWDGDTCGWFLLHEWPETLLDQETASKLPKAMLLWLDGVLVRLIHSMSGTLWQLPIEAWLFHGAMLILLFLQVARDHSHSRGVPHSLCSVPLSGSLRRHFCHITCCSSWLKLVCHCAYSS